MLGWIALLKTTLPYVTQIVTSAIPAFTSKPEASVVDPVLSKQIEELQAAATKNAESIQVLAEKLQQTILGIESAADSLQKQDKQLEELQSASTKNAELVQVLTEKLQQTILETERATNSSQKQATMFKTLLFASLAISIIALALAAWAIAH